MTMPGSACRWWTGAVSGQGHGCKFWLASVEGRDIVAIAHRFGSGSCTARRHPSAPESSGIGVTNTLCQRIEPGHVEASTQLRSRREWATRRMLAGSPLGDRRAARGRARAQRDAVRAGRELFETAVAAGLPPGRQMPLWEQDDPDL